MTLHYYSTKSAWPRPSLQIPQCASTSEELDPDPQLQQSKNQLAHCAIRLYDFQLVLQSFH